MPTQGRYPIVALLSSSASFGGVAALGVASLVMTSNFDWRIAFWAGAGIATIGVAARTRLRETSDVVGLKRDLKKLIEIFSNKGYHYSAQILANAKIWKEKATKKTLAAYFLISCSFPLTFYFVYIYCSGILTNEYSFSSAQIIKQNFFVALVGGFNSILFAFLSSKIHPLKLLRFKLICFFPLAVLCPFILDQVDSANGIFYIQLVSILVALDEYPAKSVLLIYLPVFRRFTYASFSYALSRALMYAITSFGMIYLTDYFGYKGLWIMAIPMAIGVYWSMKHFMNLEELYNPGLFSKPQKRKTTSLGIPGASFG